MSVIHDRIAEANVRTGIRALVRQHGATRAAKMLRMPRETVLGIAADARVMDANLIVAGQRLSALAEAAAS